MTLPDPPILVITDRRQSGEPLEDRAAALFRGGCRFVSLREKDLMTGTRKDLLEKLLVAAEPFGATVCVHDDPDAAKALGCALHLPAGGDISAARNLLGEGAIIGQSCHSRAEIAAAAGNADYVTIGPLFASASKPGYPPLADAAGAIAGNSVPILALGGITLDTLPRVPAGFAGIAVMGQAMTTPDPSAWFASLRMAWASIRRA